MATQSRIDDLMEKLRNFSADTNHLNDPLEMLGEGESVKVKVNRF